MTEQIRKALELARAEIRGLTAFSGQGVLTELTLAAIEQALSASPHLTDDEIMGRGPAGITKHSFLLGWRMAEKHSGIGQEGGAS